MDKNIFYYANIVDWRNNNSKLSKSYYGLFWPVVSMRVELYYLPEVSVMPSLDE